SWSEACAESLTRDGTFSTWSGSSVAVEMMRAPLHQGYYAETEQWQAVSLPYSDGRLEMLVVLPAPDTAPEFAASLDADVLETVIEQLEWNTVDLTLPKFELTSKWGLRDSLTAMGMSAPFVNAQDFSPIADGMMPIFQVFHDVAIAIDEKGTEAAAATAVVFGEDGGEDPVAQATVVVDRTFYLAIQDRQAGAVMFFARIGDPTAS
ncbi:MAG: serpin family protein, partial [Nannocystaceae bacterium]